VKRLPRDGIAGEHPEEACVSDQVPPPQPPWLDYAPWDPSLKRIMDWDLFMSLLTRGMRFPYLSYPVGAFRAHDDRITSKPPSDSHEEDEVASRYGLPRDVHDRWRLSRRGCWLHPVYKFIDGAYVRQLEARSLRGRNLLWFASGRSRRDVGLPDAEVIRARADCQLIKSAPAWLGVDSLCHSQVYR
jgi:hypothetical protein